MEVSNPARSGQELHDQKDGIDDVRNCLQPMPLSMVEEISSLSALNEIQELLLALFTHLGFYLGFWCNRREQLLTLFI